MRIKLLFLLIVSLGAPPCWSDEFDSSYTEKFSDHKYNAHSLQEGQADISLFGYSRLSIVDNLEVHANLLSNILATKIPIGSFNVGIKHKMWEKGRLTTAFSSELLFQSLRENTVESSFYGSINGIISSYVASERLAINFGPQWSYKHLHSTINHEGFVYWADLSSSHWVGLIGWDYRARENWLFSVNYLSSIANKIRTDDVSNKAEINSYLEASSDAYYINFKFIGSSGDFEFGAFKDPNYFQSTVVIPYINYIWKIR